MLDKVAIVSGFIAWVWVFITVSWSTVDAGDVLLTE